MDDLDSLDLVPILKKLPVFQPRLIALAWELVDIKTGEIDDKKAALNSLELNLAMDEVGNNSRDTRELVECLKKLLRS